MPADLGQRRPVMSRNSFRCFLLVLHPCQGLLHPQHACGVGGLRMISLIQKNVSKEISNCKG